MPRSDIIDRCCHAASDGKTGRIEWDGSANCKLASLLICSCLQSNREVQKHFFFYNTSIFYCDYDPVRPCVVLPQGLKGRARHLVVVRVRAGKCIMSSQRWKYKCVSGMAAVHVQFLLSLTVMLASFWVFMFFFLLCVHLCGSQLFAQ